MVNVGYSLQSHGGITNNLGLDQQSLSSLPRLPWFRTANIAPNQPMHPKTISQRESDLSIRSLNILKPTHRHFEHFQICFSLEEGRADWADWMTRRSHLEMGDEPCLLSGEASAGDCHPDSVVSTGSQLPGQSEAQSFAVSGYCSICCAALECSWIQRLRQRHCCVGLIQAECL